MTTNSAARPMPDGPFRIAIDAWPFGGNPSGFTVYLGSVIGSLRRAGFEVTLLSVRPLRTDYPEIAGLEPVVFGGPGRIRWEQRDLPRYLSEGGFDVYFSAANRGVPFRKAPGTRYILCLHDLIPLIFFRLYFLKDRARLLRRQPGFREEMLSMGLSVFLADSIVTVSQASLRDIQKLTRRRDVTARPPRLPDVPVLTSEAPLPQFVYIGGEERRKQIGPLLGGFARLLELPESAGCRLLMIGQYHDWYGLAETLGISDRIDWVGWVTHEEKFRIMGRSLAVVYPSLYEGYGLAIAEGMQAGVPVIAGRAGSQAEIGGDAVRYVDPTDPAEIAQAMREMLDQETRRRWIERGSEQVRVLTDEKVERDVVDYFRHQAELARLRRKG